MGVASEETHLESVKRYSDFTRLHQQLQKNPELLRHAQGLSLSLPPSLSPSLSPSLFPLSLPLSLSLSLPLSLSLSLVELTQLADSPS